MKELNHGKLGVLVLRTQKGDTEAFAELYSLTYDKVYNFAYHYLHDPDAAQDAVQDVFICALKNIHSLNDPTLFVAWINQIAFRTCFDICKKNDRSYGLVDDEILETFCDEHVSSNPEASAELSDEKARLQAAIEKLPPLQQDIIVLRYFNNMGLADIADALDISLSSVKRHIKSAIATLKNSMGG